MRHQRFSYNEESGRYRRPKAEFYVPGPGRKLVEHSPTCAARFIPNSIVVPALL